MSKILIAGLGDVGQQLARELLARGHQVWGIKRKPLAGTEAITNTSNKKISCKLVLADLTKPESLQSIPQDLDYMVFCPTPDERTESAYHNIFVSALQNVLNVLNFKHLKRIFYISSTGVYGQNQGEWVDEQSLTSPARFSGRVLLQAEDFLQKQGVPNTAIRLAGIYGPGRHQLLKNVLSGQFKAGAPMAYTNRIHRDDAARMIAFLIAQDGENKILAPVYIGVDDQPCAKEEVISWLFEQLCRRFGSKAVQAMQQSSQAIDNKRNHSNLNKRCSNQEIRAAGFVFKYPDYQSGYRDVLLSLTDVSELV